MVRTILFIVVALTGGSVDAFSQPPEAIRSQRHARRWRHDRRVFRPACRGELQLEDPVDSP
jgi:hypothetical protein